MNRLVKFAANCWPLRKEIINAQNILSPRLITNSEAAPYAKKFKIAAAASLVVAVIIAYLFVSSSHDVVATISAALCFIFLLLLSAYFASIYMLLNDPDLQIVDAQKSEINWQSISTRYKLTLIFFLLTLLITIRNGDLIGFCIQIALATAALLLIVFLRSD